MGEKKQLPREEMDKWALMIINGEKTEDEVVKELGFTDHAAKPRVHYWVVSYLRRNNMEMKVNNKELTTPELKDKVAKLYLEEGKSANEVCREYKLSTFTIKKWVKEYQDRKESGELSTLEVQNWPHEEISDELKQEMLEYYNENGKNVMKTAKYFHRNYNQVLYMIRREEGAAE